MTHDPSEYIKGLQQLLVSDKKNIAFLFGAGTSLSKKNKNSIIIPAMEEMTENIEKKLSENEPFKKALEEIKKEIGDGYNIESLLSNIELKIQVMGDSGSLNGLCKEDFKKLIKQLKQEIKKIVSVHDKILDNDNLSNLIHVDFAEWIGRANRKHSIEIFTTNYDYLFELGLEEKKIPFYDGFTGSYNPFFNAESIEDMGFIPKQTKLWKIHGSLGWHYDSKAKKICRKESEEEDILIYPSTLKYSESNKQPYTALMDRLTNFLKQPDTILITCGYSFSDEHINERILTALHSNDSGHVVALFYGSLDEDSNLKKLAESNKKLSAYGAKNAIIGGQFGDWQLKREPDKDDTINVNIYFDEDAGFDLGIEKNTDAKGNEEWTGKGKLILPDFSKFVAFLQSMILKDNYLDDVE
jgi:hypothetical protein